MQRASISVGKDKTNWRSEQLNEYYTKMLLQYQSHTLGLFPRGRSQHARVRDNVYCAMSLWALSRAYRHVGCDEGRGYELEQSAVKCMRGILFCYMRQSAKVELFKSHRMSHNALHSRYDCITGNPVTSDTDWGHLQIDGTSLFLLVLAQMISSGVQVILSKDEVDFIQNLVYYIERAYRTPDYGMWERGSKENVSCQELHASSIGMAKAALNAIHGLNLFGPHSSPHMIIHVDPDAQYRNHVILSTLLPKESSSKETDSSLLCITGFPAFCIDKLSLQEETEKKIKTSLEGSYGFKRFIKDGHHTVREDTKKQHYEPRDLEAFEGIECEWPLFYIYAYITEMFRGNQQSAETYWKKLVNILIENEYGFSIVPKLYYYPENELNNKKEKRIMVHLKESTPFLWSQSLFIIAQLLRDKLLTVSELDPIGLHFSSSSLPLPVRVNFNSPHNDIIVQVALISENTKLQSILATYGIPTQTAKQIEPITINSPGDVLLQVYSHLGENKKLGLTGRPLRPIGAIGTSKIYKILGRLAVFYPTDLNIFDFYMSYDIKLFIDTIKSIIRFLHSYWNINGRPTVTILLRQNLFQGGYFKDMVSFLAQIRGGEVTGIKVRLDRLQALVSTSCVDVLDCIGEEDDIKMAISRSPRLRSRSSSLSLGPSPSTLSLNDDDVLTVETLQTTRFDSSLFNIIEEEPTYDPSDLKPHSAEHLQYLLEKESNLLGKLYLLREMSYKTSPDHLVDNVSITEHIENVYEQAAAMKHWMAVRLGASILHKVVDCLAPSLSHLLVKEKEVSIGVFGFPEYTITEPLPPKEIARVMYDQCMPYQPIEAVLQQELLIYLGDFTTRSDMTSLFESMLRFRLGWIIQAMKNELNRSDPEQVLYQLAPFEMKRLLKETLMDDITRTALYQRQLDGALNRVPANFYSKVYNILKKTSGGITVRGKTLPQYPTVQTHSGHERSFAKEVERLLSEINNPEYRQLVVELLMVVSTILQRNPELQHNSCINVDKLLNDAFHLLRSDIENGLIKEGTDSSEQDPFYTLPVSGTHGSITYMSKAVVRQLLHDGIDSSCVVS